MSSSVWVLRSKKGQRLGQLAGSLSKRQVRGIGTRMASALGRAVCATLEKVTGAVKRNARRPKRGARSLGRVSRATQSRRRATRRNPSAADLRRATKTFQMWHGFGPSDLERVRADRQLPRVLVKMGELAAVEYLSNKWTGRTERYRHVLKKPRPLLCTGPDAKGIFVVGGRAKVTERGLVD